VRAHRGILLFRREASVDMKRYCSLLLIPGGRRGRQLRIRSLGTTGILIAVIAVVLTLAACGSSTSTGTTSSAASPSATIPGAVPSIAAMVPSDIRNAGTLTVPTDADYPPFEFLAADGKTMTGLSTDLMNAVLKTLGLTPDIKIVSFDSIVPGFAANRWQVALAAVNVTPERTKVVDFVTYDRGADVFYQSGTGTFQLPASYAAIEGHTLAVLKGSSQAASAEAEAAKLKASGKTTTLLEYTTNDSVNLAVQSSRADFAVGSADVVGYLIKQTAGKFKTASAAFNYSTLVGFAVGKNSGMAQPMLAALQYLQKDGTYQAIFEKWGQQQGMLKTPTIATGS
jgi:polar amino acid transport system substrate-binding protein